MRAKPAGTPIHASHTPAPKVLRTKARRWGAHTYVSFAPSSRATSRAIRFSKPLSSLRENGRLSGSAHTRNSPAWASVAKKNRLRKRKDMQLSAFNAVPRQVLHRVAEAERRRFVARVDVLRYDCAGPAADALQHCDVLLAAVAGEGNRLADDSRLG